MKSNFIFKNLPEHRNRLTLDGQLFPRPQPPKDRLPGGHRFPGPYPEDGAHAHEHAHEMPQKERPQGRTLRPRCPPVLRGVFVAERRENAGGRHDVERAEDAQEVAGGGARGGARQGGGRRGAGPAERRQAAEEEQGQACAQV